MGKFSDIVRNLDMFGMPVTLSFKRKRNFKTVLGGSISIFLTMVFLSEFLYQMINELSNPAFSASPSVTKIADSFEFDYRQAMVAGRVQPLSEDVSQSQIDANFRIVFIYAEYKTRKLKAAIPSVRCLDLYSEVISEDTAGEYSKVFQSRDDSPWICPNITQGEINKS